MLTAYRAVVYDLATPFSTICIVLLDRLLKEDSGVEGQSEEHFAAVWLRVIS